MFGMHIVYLLYFIFICFISIYFFCVLLPEAMNKDEFEVIEK